MKCIHVAGACLILGGCGPEEPAPVLACNLTGLTATERTESHALLERLGAAIVATDELSDGFAFRLEETRLPLAALSRWVDLERRCCPFFHFDIDVSANGGTWLRLTGGAGVKDFIRTAIGRPEAS